MNPWVILRFFGFEDKIISIKKPESKDTILELCQGKSCFTGGKQHVFENALKKPHDSWCFFNALPLVFAGEGMSCHHVMTCHHVMKWHYVMPYQHVMKWHCVMTCHHTMPCQHAMQCHHVMKWHYVMASHHVMSRLGYAMFRVWKILGTAFAKSVVWRPPADSSRS